MPTEVQSFRNTMARLTEIYNRNTSDASFIIRARCDDGNSFDLYVLYCKSAGQAIDLALDRITSARFVGAPLSAVVIDMVGQQPIFFVEYNPNLSDEIHGPTLHPPFCSVCGCSELDACVTADDRCCSWSRYNADETVRTVPLCTACLEDQWATEAQAK